MRQVRRVVLACLLTTAAGFAGTAFAATASSSAAVLMGDQTVESTVGTAASGSADAFALTAGQTGTASSISVYLDGQNRATTLWIGLYSDGDGHPGSLLASGSTSSPDAGAWNTVPIAQTTVSAQSNYWIAVLGTGGTLYFRQDTGGSCQSESSGSRRLRSLPSSWRTGASGSGCPISAYASGTRRRRLRGRLRGRDAFRPDRGIQLLAIGSGYRTDRALRCVGNLLRRDALHLLLVRSAPIGRHLSARFGNRTRLHLSGGRDEVRDADRHRFGGENLERRAQRRCEHPPDSDAPPVNTAPPSISGTARQGQVLSTSNGSWINGATDVGYAWQDCNTSGSSCNTISGAASASYTLTAADVGHTVRSVVTASNAAGSASATSSATGVVGAASQQAPVNTAAPSISGAAQQGQQLTTSNGSWSNSPTDFGYAWQDCNSSGGSCDTISGAASASYTLTAADVGHTVRAVVTASNAGGSASASSSVTAVVTAAGPPPPPPGSCDLNATPSSFASQVAAASSGQTVCLATGSYGTWTGTSRRSRSRPPTEPRRR